MEPASRKGPWQSILQILELDEATLSRRRRLSGSSQILKTEVQSPEPEQVNTPEQRQAEALEELVWHGRVRNIYAPLITLVVMYLGFFWLFH